MDLLEVKGDTVTNRTTMLGIPPAKLTVLKSTHHSTNEQQAAVVMYWLQHDPLASWRRIIFQLDEWVPYGHHSVIADRIRHYAEELTGIVIITLDTLGWLN